MRCLIEFIESYVVLQFISSKLSAKRFCKERNLHTAISIKVVPKQSGKVEYERERLLGIANKFDCSALLGDNLN
jgi:hypothetical protein